jgi:DNA-binding SARP family transcriptional activator
MSDALHLSSIDLSLLGAFSFRRSGQAEHVPRNGARLLAFLALHGPSTSRRRVAYALWPEKPSDRAAGNLRSVIWRLPSGVVETTGSHLALAEGVRCDLTDFTRRAHRLINGVPLPTPDDLDAALYSADLLPAWSDDWVAIEQERILQLRIHALESLSRRLTEAGRYCDAIAAGLAAVAAEPLRESAHRTVIAAHLAEGNPAEALRHYETFRRLLAAELGLQPSPQLGELIGDVTPMLTAG